MIEKIFIISFLVFAINYTMKPGEIFGIVNTWFANMNERLKQPLYECPVCMVPYYGSVLYWAIWGAWLHVARWQEWLIVIIGAMGVNAIINQLSPNKDEPRIEQKVVDAFNKCQGSGIREERILEKEWLILFNYYNINKSTDMPVLGMRCGHCYGKVLAFVRSKIEAVNA